MASRKQRATEEYGPYHRFQSAADNELVARTGLLGGRPARNIAAGLIAKVKAFTGPLPPGRKGIEFMTDVAPDEGHGLMRRAQPNELQEDAVPAMVLQTSKQRLRELFPVRFSAMDTFAEAEPSRGALLQLNDGPFVVVIYGTLSHRTTVSVPVSANVRKTIQSLVREVGITRDDILWAAEGALRITTYNVSGKYQKASTTIRNQSDADLRTRERELRNRLAKLRFQHVTGRQKRHPENIVKVRRELAHIKALLSSRTGEKHRA